MNAVFKLFKLQIDEIYNVFKSRYIQKLLRSLGKYVLLIVLLTLGVYLCASQIFLLGFERNVELLSIILLVTQLISLIFATGNIITNLYLNKNNEILLTMPASSNQIFISKTLVIYVQEVVINSIYTLPILIVYGILSQYSAFFYALLPLYMLLLPLLPLSIAALVSIPMTKLLQFLKKHVIVSTIAIIVLVGALLIIYVNVLQAFASFNIAEDQLRIVTQINTKIINFGKDNHVFIQLANAMTKPSKMYWTAAYLLLGAACFYGATFLIRPFFFKLAMSSQEDSVSAVKSKKFKRTGVFVSLIKKEALTVFRHPGYVFQYFIFTLLMPIIVLLYDRLLLSLEIVTKTGHTMIAGAHVLIITMLALLSNIISASAISREGGNFYIIKTTPVNYYIQTAAKVVFNAIFTTAAIILTGILSLATRESLSVATIVCSSVSAIFLSIGHICLSFDYDLKKPTLNWHDSGDITRVSSNTTKSIVWAMGASIVSGVLIMFLASTKHLFLPWLVLLLISAFFCVYRIFLLILRASYQYERLEM